MTILFWLGVSLVAVGAALLGFGKSGSGDELDTLLAQFGLVLAGAGAVFVLIREAIRRGWFL